MSHPNKRRGTAAEVALRDWLVSHGHPETVRNPPAGSKDVGDLTCDTFEFGDDLCPDCGFFGPEDVDCVIEVKSFKDVAAALRQGVAELETEMGNAGTDHGVLVVKRRGVSDPGEWFAVRKVRNDPEIGAL
jgi:hypothetical protein